MRFALACLIAGMLAGCASTASSSDSASERPIANGVDVARSVVLCQTTGRDLQTRLGTPSRDGTLGRARLLTWVVAWDPLVRYLGVMLDERDRVVDAVWDLPSEVVWTPTNRCPAP